LSALQPTNKGEDNRRNSEKIFSHLVFGSLLQFIRLTNYIRVEVNNMQLTNMKQTAELIGVTYSALQSAVFHGKIPEPKTKIGSHKLFDIEEVGNARKYFEQNRKKREAGRQP